MKKKILQYLAELKDLQEATELELDRMKKKHTEYAIHYKVVETMKELEQVIFACKCKIDILKKVM